MKVLLSWIREFVDVPGTPDEIGAHMSLRGLALDGIEAAPDVALPPGRTHAGPDAVLDFDVTANRPDCLSVLGIAREMATHYRLPLRNPAAGAKGLLHAGDLRTVETLDQGLTVTISEPALCARYAAAAMDVRPGPSPDWMQARLQALGVRPIGNVVDVTNYVLLELGQPMHAFDVARLAGPAIEIRRARPGEPITTLDGKPRILSDDMLVIADRDGAAAIAGVMGGARSEVSPTTTRILLESAWFRPQSVRATSKQLGLRTEASHRFERGADITIAGRAMARACALLESIGAGKNPGVMIDAYPVPFTSPTLAISGAQIHRLLGMQVPADEVERILAALGFSVRRLGGWQQASTLESPVPMAQAGDGWHVDVPAWRGDVRRTVDLIEEVARHYGFEHLPTTFPPVEQPPPPAEPRVARDARVRRLLLGAGFSEAITFAFIDRPAAAAFAEGRAALDLANPLSEKFTTMRPSLLPGLIDAVSHNVRRERRDVRLFEIGTRFSADGEERAAAIVMTGLAAPEHWSGGRREVDFFDVRGVVEQLCASLSVSPTIVAAVLPYLRQGRSAEILVDGSRSGVLGLLEPAVAEARDLPRGQLIYVAELRLDALGLETSRVAHVEPLPRFPSVVRDLSILVDDRLSAEAVRGTIRAAAPATLAAIREFDRYQGEGVPQGQVSLSLRLQFQAPDRTLTDAEVQEATSRILEMLKSTMGAVQR